MHAWVEGVTSQARGAVKKVSIAPHGRAQWHSDSFNDPQQSWMSTPLSVMPRRSLTVMMLTLFASGILCCTLSVRPPVGIILSHWERLDFPHASNTADMRCPSVHPPSGIILSHWGRMDFPHTSNSQYHADNYGADVQHEWFPGGWLAHSSKTHPCFDPNKVMRD